MINCVLETAHEFMRYMQLLAKHDAVASFTWLFLSFLKFISIYLIKIKAVSNHQQSVVCRTVVQDP